MPAGTLGIAVLNEEAHSHARNDRWEAVIKERDQRRLTMSVMVPVDAPIGMWEAAIETSYENER